MAVVSRPYRLVNPGKRRKKNPKRMSLAQKLHFGTKRQRAAAQASLRRNRTKRKNSGQPWKRSGRIERLWSTVTKRKRRQNVRQNVHYLGKTGTLKSGKKGYVYTNRGRKNPRYVRALGTNYSVIRPGHKVASQGTKPGYLYSNPGRRKRRKNVGQILTVFNPGVKRRKKTNMATTRRRRRRTNSMFGRRRRRRMNPFRRRRRSNPMPVARRRRRRYGVARRNPGRVRHYRRHYSRRRNPDFLTGEAGVIVGVVGGATVTNLLMGTLQSAVSAVSSGVPAYIAGALVAFLQGKLVGKFTKNPQLGKYMAAGGYTWVALTMLHDFLPAFPNPFANLSGMGLLTSSNNWGPPWVNVGSSMTRFVRPGGVVAAIPPPAPSPGMSGMRGFGRLRRGGRLA